MRKWINPGGAGKLAIGSLPEHIVSALIKHTTRVLERHGQPDHIIATVSQNVVHAVSQAYVARDVKLESSGQSRPPRASGNLLSCDIADLLSRDGLRGNWLALGDADEDGVPGLVAELEAIAQTHLRQACGMTAGVMARPARISDARKLLGKISRG